MNREAIHQMTGLPDRAVVFVRFEGEARNKQCLPYFIAVDERSKAVGELQRAACNKHWMDWYQQVFGVSAYRKLGCLAG